MDGKEQYLAENIMNVVAFVPIGLLLGIGIPRLKWWYALLIGFCLSSSIEILQFVFKKGFSEFDDVIHNTFGCILGYILVKGSRLMVKSSGLINRIIIKTV
jgi:glycopeptide antibiotics resistance protein